jgi:hypothetical protein
MISKLYDNQRILGAPDHTSDDDSKEDFVVYFSSFVMVM